MQEPPGAQDRSAWASVRHHVERWVREDSRRAIVTALIAFAVAWVVNVYIIAVRYEGTSTVPGGAATNSGNRLTGAIFWIVISTVVLTIVGYAQQVGWSRLGAELRVLPGNLVSAFQAAEGSLRWAALLWGAAVSLLVAILFSSAAAGALGLGVLLVAASPVVGIAGRVLRRLGRSVLGTVAGDRARLLDSSQATVATLVGAAVGMAVAWQVGPWLYKLVLAVAAAAGAAVLLKSGDTAAAATTTVLTLLVAVAVHDLLGGIAMADDGGWQEGGGTFTAWFGSEGSGRVMTQSVLGGLSGAFGAVVGSATGSALGAVVGSAAGSAAASAAGSASGAAAGSTASAPLGGLSGEYAAAETGAAATAPSVSLAIGGLSGDFTGGTSDAAGRGGAAPGRADQEPDDEDAT